MMNQPSGLGERHVEEGSIVQILEIQKRMAAVPVD